MDLDIIVEFEALSTTAATPIPSTFNSSMRVEPIAPSVVVTVPDLYFQKTVVLAAICDQTNLFLVVL